MIKPLNFPGGPDGKESACSARDPGFTSGLERSPGEGNSTPLQHSCLENPMDRGAWRAPVHGSQRVGHDRATNTHLGAQRCSHYVTMLLKLDCLIAKNPGISFNLD